MNADPRGGWARTAVDFYIGGLVDAFVSALDTTFLDGAVLLRSQSCCGATSRMHFSAEFMRILVAQPKMWESTLTAPCASVLRPEQRMTIPGEASKLAWSNPVWRHVADLVTFQKHT